MTMSRREFLQALAVASAAGFNLAGCDSKSSAQAAKFPSDLYNVPPKGNVSFMHYTDCHAQLLPVYFREPSINLGVADMKGRPPHVVGEAFLDHYGIKKDSALAYAYTYLGFEEMAERYGKMGGFAHLATLINKIRESRPNSLLLDGGDTWQGSATALWTNAQDMIDAQLKLGVDVMCPHWEFTYGADRVKEVLANDFKGKIDFVAQNVVDRTWQEGVFDPYTMKEINGVQVAIVGQAFPYTPIANPAYQVPDWSFGVRDGRMQKMVDKARKEGAQVVVVLSHNGMDVDLKMASQVTGIDAIMGGHTHDAMPEAMEVQNAGGKTLVVNSGSNGKFLSVLDLDVRDGKIKDYQFNMLPVFSNMLDPDPDMAKYIEDVRAPYTDRLNEELAVAGELLYRRGNFNGTFDQVICDALREVKGADIALSPGFRWGVSVLPGDPITFEQVMTQTAITYPVTTLNKMTGERIKLVLEDIADNLFNEDPYYQQGGDMVRVGGMNYTIDPRQEMGKRISDIEINGEPISPNKEYTVAGWASVDEPLQGRPIWEVVSEYLRGQDTVELKEFNVPKVKGMKDNPGLGTIKT